MERKENERCIEDCRVWASYIVGVKGGLLSEQVSGKGIIRRDKKDEPRRVWKLRYNVNYIPDAYQGRDGEIV